MINIDIKKFILETIDNLTDTCCHKFDYECEDCLLQKIKMNNETDLCDELQKISSEVNISEY